MVRERSSFSHWDTQGIRADMGRCQYETHTHSLVTQGGLVSRGKEGEGGRGEDVGSYEKLQCTVHIQYTHMYMYLSLSPSSSRFFIMVW